MQAVEFKHDGAGREADAGYFQPNLPFFDEIWLEPRKQIHKSARIDVWYFHYFFAKRFPINKENTTFAQILHQ